MIPSMMETEMIYLRRGDIDTLHGGDSDIITVTRVMFSMADGNDIAMAMTAAYRIRQSYGIDIIDDNSGMLSDLPMILLCLILTLFL